MTAKRRFTDAEVTHMRKLLAWMRTEYCLDEDMQRGALGAVKTLLDAGQITQEQAEQQVAKRADQVRQVPQYVRQAVKMLTKAVREYDGVKGAVVDVATRDVHEIE
ncbi:hypothetical protein [Duganella vulcania]|uniref:Uncharacterized protein n=1 Tax=Duganella vulcania TaxID=2692166 RepID=A0A845GD75_9BURK|nr:hypothetical protein [Duganella vulcania]MYM92573.1 hypothetical protein [Duganella vulcania]